MEWKLRTTAGVLGAPLLAKTSCAGVTVALDAEDSFVSDAEHRRPTKYAHGLARTDVPSVLVYGTATLGIATTLH